MVKLFKKYLKYYKPQLIIGPLCKLLEAIFELIVPLVMARYRFHYQNGRSYGTFERSGTMQCAGVPVQRLRSVSRVRNKNEK